MKALFNRLSWLSDMFSKAETPPAAQCGRTQKQIPECVDLYGEECCSATAPQTFPCGKSGAEGLECDSPQCFDFGCIETESTYRSKAESDRIIAENENEKALPSCKHLGCWSPQCDDFGCQHPEPFKPKPLTLYISGQITEQPSGKLLPNYKDKFAAAERLINTAGYKAINPTALDHSKNTEWVDFMRTDIAALMRADALITLPCWHKSKGAKLEVSIAQSLGLPVLPIEAFTTKDYHRILTKQKV